MAEVAEIRLQVEGALARIDDEIDKLMDSNERARAEKIAEWKNDKKRDNTNLWSMLIYLDLDCSSKVAELQKQKYNIIGTAFTKIEKIKSQIEKDFNIKIKNQQEYKDGKAAAEKDIKWLEPALAEAKRKRDWNEQLNDAAEVDIVNYRQKKKVKFDREHAKLPASIRRFSMTPEAPTSRPRTMPPLYLPPPPAGLAPAPRPPIVPATSPIRSFPNI